MTTCSRFVVGCLRPHALRSLTPPRSSRRQVLGKRLGYEILENRWLLAGVTVDTITDVSDGDTSSIAALLLNNGADGSISLREAISAANNTAGPDTINFDTTGVFASPQTITLDGTQLPTIAGSLAIAGTGAENLTIDANQLSRIFNVDDGDAGNQIDVEISGVKLISGVVLGAFGSGGAVFSRENLTLSSSEILGNSAGSRGGGIYSTAQLTIQNSTISGNLAANGGGIFARGLVTNSSAAILNSTFVNNTAYYLQGATRRGTGGGIYASGVDATTFENSTSQGNYAVNGGGIAIVMAAANAQTTTIQNSTFSANVAQHGGGLRINSGINGSTTIQNSTISGNAADFGGGMQFSSSGPIAVKSTIVAGNVALTAGQAPDLDVTVSGNFTVTTSLIGNNTGSGLAEDQMGLSGNLVGSFAGGGIIDPLLDPLANNGGPTQTHALSPLSPAIDRGSNPASLVTDQRGGMFARVNRERADMGAFEYQFHESLLVTTAVDEDDASSDPLFGTGTSLREAMAYANLHPGSDTITFETSGVFATQQTITLGGMQLPTITDSVMISGTGAENLTIDANQLSRIFHINDGNNSNHRAVEIVGLTLRGGAVGNSTGGAILSHENLTLRDSVVTGNSAGSGGGLYAVAYGPTTIENSTFSNNIANFYGGGLQVYTRPTGVNTISNSTFSGNSAGFGGGGIDTRVSGGIAMFQNTTVTGNSTGGSGGGIHEFAAFGAVTTIRNSTVTGNTAANHGGIYSGNFGGTTLESSIVAGNGASSQAPDLYFSSGSVSFSLIGDNTGSGLTEAQTPDIHGNLVGQPASAGGAGVIDPLLSPLADNGGSTQTHALAPVSRAIDRGSNSAGLVTDQRGGTFARVNRERADIGAYEFQFNESLVVTTILDEDNASSDPSFGAGTSLREAIAYANVRPGMDAITFDATVFATPSVITLGGSELPTVTDSLVIMGPGAAWASIDANHLSRIFHVDDGIFGNHIVVEIVGLTLTGGMASGLSPADEGGAIFSREMLTVRASVIAGNAADHRGGGIFAYGPQTTIQDSILSGNSAARGGAIYAIQPLQGDYVTTIQNSTLSGNTAIRSAQAFSGRGGGLATSASSGITTIEYSTLSGNTAFYGGGVFFQAFGNATAMLRNSTLSENYAYFGGGAAFNLLSASANATIRNSTLSGNSAVYGGGVNINASASNTATLQNSTLTENYAYNGGGIFSSGSDPTITSSIVAVNTGARPDIEGTASVTNSLIGDNTGSGLAEAQTPDGNGNLVGKPAAAGGTGVIDPSLGPLGNHGGPTLTHELLVGSRALDLGANPAGLTYDQRGVPYVRSSGTGVDMGAVELQVSPDVDGDFNDDGIYDLLDIDALSAAIAAGTHDPLFDLTDDGLVNLADRDAWLAEAGGTNLGAGRIYLLGDANLDGVVDGQDFILWNSHKFTASNQWSRGDFNADDVVDGQDFILWNTNKFTSSDLRLGGGIRLVSELPVSAHWSPLCRVAAEEDILDRPGGKHRDIRTASAPLGE